MKTPWTLLLLLLLSAPNSWALELAANARVNIVKAIDISLVSELDFGNISELNGTCTMGSSGTLSASDGQDCSGTSTPGVFQVAGTNGQTIIMNVTAGAAVDGINFTPKIDGSNTRTLVDGNANIEIIGHLTLSDTTLGDKNIAYTVTANYQ
ncbi:DUF4402 domain-containing protein [Oceanicoccus sagamiensis]|uniref:Spore coat protein U domain-containing protein n=1 Tax=Oceanicoccus sagamiensis TaxID=716816 RepID=A0A1X9NDA8_9GAMM|nr:DUF4402 domain-containing protein [Oceanicoccus sagamiensis]ARN73519.1 hypothetical protein BST96_04930 [Oceanicoccus sagamiensis]